MTQATTDTAGWTWSSVIVGVIASLVIQAMLIMLGIGVGLLSMGSSADTAEFAWAAFGWWACSGIIAAFVGGWIAGALSPMVDPRMKGVAGLTTWAVATLIVLGVAGVAGGTGGTIMSNLAGPTAETSARLGRPSQAENVGQAGPARPDPGALESAQRHLSAAMLASFVALLIGAGVAYAGGSMARTMPGRAYRTV
ncbi:MAG: hypothetical protein IRZ09_08110 [Variibacter sp.]|nr:hypothetical protein [Variibacter sp.]